MRSLHFFRINRRIAVCLIGIVLVLVVADFIVIRKLYRNYLGSKIKNEIDFTKADNVSGFPEPIVPNIVHFIKFVQHRLDFVEMINIRAVHANQRPDKILIHCDCEDLEGPYWPLVRNLSGLELRYLARPTSVFGRTLSSIFHSSDVARLHVLRTHGGIYLDSDVYVVRSLDPLRKFEFTVGWPLGENIGNQVLIAHRKARLLTLWLESYRHYRPFLWYYNAGQLPTESILIPSPHLVHREPVLLGVNYLFDELYKTYWRDWKTYFTVHLLTRHRSYLDATSPVKEFDENTIKDYQFTYGEMARLVYYGKTDIIRD